MARLFRRSSALFEASTWTKESSSSASLSRFLPSASYVGSRLKYTTRPGRPRSETVLYPDPPAASRNAGLLTTTFNTSAIGMQTERKAKTAVPQHLRA
ncbi:Hypp8269 [Branchiostoma lanceolatum]|uniref:Hypp8269 protein n=1 Tax=Branchiostoma lanceolatum TaxID=7740 RepID=A0A8J9Z7I5_BRALA|nr:Hypp8269 [Branchiostoma lanceolatum]